MPWRYWRGNWQLPELAPPRLTQPAEQYPAFTLSRVHSLAGWLCMSASLAIPSGQARRRASPGLAGERSGMLRLPALPHRSTLLLEGKQPFLRILASIADVRLRPRDWKPLLQRLALPLTRQTRPAKTL